MLLWIPGILPHRSVVITRKVDTLQAPSAGSARLAEKSEYVVPHLFIHRTHRGSTTQAAHPARGQLSNESLSILLQRRIGRATWAGAVGT